MQRFFSEREVVDLIGMGRVIDGTRGGVVFGEKHHGSAELPKGGIPVLQRMAEGGYYVAGLVEGGEFILSPEASLIHLLEVEKLNEFPPALGHPLPSLPASWEHAALRLNGDGLRYFIDVSSDCVG